MSVDPPPTLVLFPGLGVDERLYGPQQNLPVRLDVPRWIEPESMDETLSHYSQRMAAAIPPRPNLYIGGVSLGAMVALEVARHVRATAALLIGGCHSHRQISPLFRSVLRLASWMPRGWVHPSLAVAPLAFKLFERLPSDQSRLMTTMLRSHSPTQLQWSAGAILGWSFDPRDTDPPVYAVHGEDDEVIPLKNVRPDQVVPGGRHLISLSHPDQVNGFLEESVGLNNAFT